MGACQSNHILNPQRNNNNNKPINNNNIKHNATTESNLVSSHSTQPNVNNKNNNINDTPPIKEDNNNNNNVSTDIFLDSISDRNDRIKFEDLVFLENMDDGSFGEVFHGTLWGQDVAIKRMRIKSENGIDAFKLLQHEVAMLRSVGHPNIVQYLGACFEKEHCCIVTEYVQSGSLAKVLKESTKISLGKYLKIAIGIASGLNWLHHRKIIHRDLKPSNILVGKHEVVKICDLGLSHTKRAGNRPGTYGLAGTMSYMAPEVLKSQRYSYPADIYSFGIILCEIGTGRRPYEAMGLLDSDATDELVEAVIDGIRPLMREDAKKMGLGSLVDWGTSDSLMPLQLESLIHECWHEDPKRRPSARNVLTRLQAVAKKVEEEQAYQREHLEEMNIPTPVQALISDSNLRVEELERALSETQRSRDQERAQLIHQIHQLQDRLLIYEQLGLNRFLPNNLEYINTHQIPMYPPINNNNGNQYSYTTIPQPSLLQQQQELRQTSYSGGGASIYQSKRPSSRGSAPESPYIMNYMNDLPPEPSSAHSYYSTHTPAPSMMYMNEPQSGVSQYAQYDNEPHSAQQQRYRYDTTDAYNTDRTDRFSSHSEAGMTRNNQRSSVSEVHMDMYDNELDGGDTQQHHHHHHHQQQQQQQRYPHTQDMSDLYYSYQIPTSYNNNNNNNNFMMSYNPMYYHGNPNTSYSMPELVQYYQRPTLSRARSEQMVARPMHVYRQASSPHSKQRQRQKSPNTEESNDKSSRSSKKRRNKRRSKRRTKEKRHHRKNTQLRPPSANSNRSSHLTPSPNRNHEARTRTLSDLNADSLPFQSVIQPRPIYPNSAHENRHMNRNNYSRRYTSPISPSPIRNNQPSPQRNRFTPPRNNSVSPASPTSKDSHHPRSRQSPHSPSNNNTQLLSVSEMKKRTISDEAMQHAKERSRLFMKEMERVALFEPRDQIPLFEYDQPNDNEINLENRKQYPLVPSRSFERLSNVEEDDERNNSNRVSSDDHYKRSFGSEKVSSGDPSRDTPVITE